MDNQKTKKAGCGGTTAPPKPKVAAKPVAAPSALKTGVQNLRAAQAILMTKEAHEKLAAKRVIAEEKLGSVQLDGFMNELDKIASSLASGVEFDKYRAQNPIDLVEFARQGRR